MTMRERDDAADPSPFVPRWLGWIVVAVAAVARVLTR